MPRPPKHPPVSKSLAASDINALRSAAEELVGSGVVALFPVQVLGVERDNKHRPLRRVVVRLTTPVKLSDKRAVTQFLLGPGEGSVPWGVDYEHPFFVFFPPETDQRDRIFVHCSNVQLEVERQ